MKSRIMSYNIEHMRRCFKSNKILPEAQPKVEAAARVIKEIAPDILGIVEASNKIKHLEVFIGDTCLHDSGYKIAKSSCNRTKQDLAFLYKEPFEVISLDQNLDFYDDWLEDIDADGIKELCHFERKPLEALFKNTETGVEFLVILVFTKSKGVFSVKDVFEHQHLALANRKRLLAQCKQIRRRLDKLLVSQPGLPIILMGDLNDEPGLDSMERMLGFSALETIMGNVFAPELIMHNVHWHMNSKPKLARQLWTTEYPDLIVQNFGLHRGWLDHILVSPNLVNRQTAPRLIPESGLVAPKNKDGALASDHYAVYCDLEFQV